MYKPRIAYQNDYHFSYHKVLTVDSQLTLILDLWAAVTMNRQIPTKTALHLAFIVHLFVNY